MKYKNIREITKKEKIRGLTRMSWNIALFGSLSFFPYISFMAILLFIFLLTIFFILEFFDDDFMEIIITKFSVRIKNEYFA